MVFTIDHKRVEEDDRSIHVVTVTAADGRSHEFWFNAAYALWACAVERDTRYGAGEDDYVLTYKDDAYGERRGLYFTLAVQGT